MLTRIYTLSYFLYPYPSLFCCSCCFFLMIRRPPRSTLTDTLFPTRRSSDLHAFFDGFPWPQIRRINPPFVPNVTSTHYLVMRSEEHTSELQSLMRISYAVFCLKKKNDR